MTKAEFIERTQNKSFLNQTGDMRYTFKPESTFWVGKNPMNYTLKEDGHRLFFICEGLGNEDFEVTQLSDDQPYTPLTFELQLRFTKNRRPFILTEIVG